MRRSCEKSWGRLPQDYRKVQKLPLSPPGSAASRIGVAGPWKPIPPLRAAVRARGSADRRSEAGGRRLHDAEGPAVAGGSPCTSAPVLSNGADESADCQCAVRAGQGALCWRFGSVRIAPGASKTDLDQAGKGDAGLAALRRGDGNVEGSALPTASIGAWATPRIMSPRARRRDNRDAGASRPRRSCRCRKTDPQRGRRRSRPRASPAPKELPAFASRNGLFVRLGFLQPLTAGTDRQGPVRAHLNFVVQGFHGFVIEGVTFLIGVLVSPRSGFRARW